MKKIISLTTNGHWWKGTISLNYNFKILAKVILALFILAAALFVAYWLVIGSWFALKFLWSSLCWCAAGLWKGLCWLAGKWMWLLEAALLALIGWLLSKVNWKNNSNKWLWVLLSPVFLIGIILLVPKSCQSSKDNQQQTILVTPEQFNQAFDWVVVSRAYLDGVQNKDGSTKIDRALVGLKFINGQPVTNMTFQGQTYEEAVAIIASNWRGLVTSNVHVPLNDNQVIAITLFAMRNGKYGFLKSDFLRNVNNGDLSSKAMALHDKNGNKRQLGTEGLQYLWVLKNLWDGNITAQELLDYPMFSYKAIGLDKMYDYEGKPMFNEELRAKLKRGNFDTPRKALEL